MTAAPTTLRDLVLDRLDKDTKPEDTWSALVLAALEGPAELDTLLEAKSPAAAPAGDAADKGKAPKDAAPPRVAFLRSITAEGFRGIGPKATLDLAPGPGLTLVVGRNGSGKSSFAEALELLLTGETYRWENRAKVWKDGWRNLHHPKAQVAAEFALEGEKGACTVAREWDEKAELDAATTTAQVHGKPRAGKDSLGWEAPLQSFRPFLSYNELGSMLDEGPSKLYDALSKVLGLDALVDAQDALQKARTTRDNEQKEADRQRKALLDRLDTLSDERAARVKEALAKKDWGLDEVEAVLAGCTPSGEKDGTIDLLQRLAALQPPDAAKVREATSALREAEKRQAQAAQTVAGKSDELASLLDHALRFHESHGDGDCPVCGKKGALDKAWHESKRQEAESLRQAAKEASDARNNLKQWIAEARKRVEIDTALLKKAEAAGLEKEASQARAAAERATPGPQAPPAELADAIDSNIDALVAAMNLLRTKAQQQLETRQDAWRPHARDLNEWLPRARKARTAAASVSNIRAAEKWMKEAADAIRNERFAPIAEKTRAIWDQLRLHSNVSLDDVHLIGVGKTRKVELKVSVDGQEGAALGVMSQGELNSLALSLFIPRATLPATPFRFIIIDDPVQSMDPIRVDGLARVLQAASKDRQVVVFTHDDRLPEAVRRLGIKATQVEVMRGEGSVVSMRTLRDPVSRYIDDALTLAKTDDLPREVMRRVVPGLCRQAIEAACMETIRRRRIGRGESHADVEDLLAGITGTKSLAALALFDNKDRAGDVLGRLNKESKTSADTFRAVNEGSHEALPGDILAVVRSSEKLAQWMQRLA